MKRALAQRSITSTNCHDCGSSLNFQISKNILTDFRSQSLLLYYSRVSPKMRIVMKWNVPYVHYAIKYVEELWVSYSVCNDKERRRTVCSNLQWPLMTRRDRHIAVMKIEHCSKYRTILSIFKDPFSVFCAAVLCPSLKRKSASRPWKALASWGTISSYLDLRFFRTRNFLSTKVTCDFQEALGPNEWMLAVFCLLWRIRYIAYISRYNKCFVIFL